MYSSFKILAVISSLLSGLLLAGKTFEIGVLLSSTFYSLCGVYFLMSGVSCILLLFRDRKRIFAKPYAFKNSLLFVLSTPIPLILVWIVPALLKQSTQDLYFTKNIRELPLCDSCVAETEALTILFQSGGPALNRDYALYYHSLAVRVGSNDTFNVLSVTKPEVNAADGRYFLYPTLTKLLEHSNESLHGSNIDDVTLKTIHWVALSKASLQMDFFERYQTVVGELVQTVPLKTKGGAVDGSDSMR